MTLKNPPNLFSSHDDQNKYPRRRAKHTDKSSVMRNPLDKQAHHHLLELTYKFYNLNNASDYNKLPKRKKALMHALDNLYRRNFYSSNKSRAIATNADIEIPIYTPKTKK